MAGSFGGLDVCRDTGNSVDCSLLSTTLYLGGSKVWIRWLDMLPKLFSNGTLFGKLRDRVVRYAGVFCGVCSVGPVGDFLESCVKPLKSERLWNRKGYKVFQAPFFEGRAVKLGGGIMFWEGFWG